MVEMLYNINEHHYKNNIDICYKLCIYIINNHIKDEKMLKSIEDGYFNTYNISERNMIKYTDYVTDYTHLEKFDQNVIAKLVEYEKIYESTNDEKVKTKILIFIYDLINWEFIFPYTAYKLIISNELN